MANTPLKWPSINQLRHVIQSVAFNTPEGSTPPILQFRGTVKLHGVNCGYVEGPDGERWMQSREEIITVDQDFMRFAAYFEPLKPLFDALLDSLPRDDQYPYRGVFGEWCGQGVQKKMAISSLEKMYVIFGVGRGKPVTFIDKNGDEQRVVEWDWMPFEEMVAYLSKPEFAANRVFATGMFQTYMESFDFSNPQSILDRTTELTHQVEACCPVGNHFGAQGIGEGIVWTCITPGWEHQRYWFKTKGEEHKTSKVLDELKANPEELKSYQEMAEKLVTEARLEQGWMVITEERKCPKTNESLGEFLAWVIADVHKEEADLLAASALDSKRVNKMLSAVAKKWFFAKVTLS